MQPSDAPADDAARTYGALTTRLSDALGRTRDALTAHAARVPGGALTDLDALLADFERRRIRIAVYGEVKAGKSTLVNALAGGLLSPVAFEPLTAIPVRITYGPTPTWRAGDQILAKPTELETLMRTSLTDPAAAHPHEVVVETNLDVLQLGGQVDLIDTPGVGADSHFDAVTAEALQGLDAVILVVRYPALFTQFTRHLVHTLDADIGKLFVVWNLDAACSDLTPADRERHAAVLRQHVAGAHELSLVDARAAFNAIAQNDTTGRPWSGIAAFTSTLRRFATSGERDLTALRQTAKRVDGWLGSAVVALRERQATLAQALGEARRQLEDAAAAAAGETAAARERFAAFATVVDQRRAAATAAAAKLACDLRRQLHAARRQWVRTADGAALEGMVAEAVTRFADALAETAQQSTQAFTSAAADFGATADLSPWDRHEPAVADLIPADRQQRATTGRWTRLRRSLWKRWYLPGLSQLETSGLADQLTTGEKWAALAAATARDAGQAVLDARLAEIDERAAAEAARIKDATNLVAVEAEHARLTADLPTVVAERGAIQQLAHEALPHLRQNTTPI